MDLTFIITRSPISGETRPTAKANIFHQGKLLATTRVLLDTGADITYLSHSFCQEHKLIEEKDWSGTSKSPFGKDLKTFMITNISIELIDDSSEEIKYRIDFDNVRTIPETNYNYPAIVGVDGLSVFKKFSVDFETQTASVSTKEEK